MSVVRPTRRGVLVLAGAVAAYLVGWAFGTRELAVLALALVLAVAIACASVWSASRTPRRMTRRLPPRAVAGQPLMTTVEVAPVPRLVSATLVERSEALGNPTAVLERDDGVLVGAWQVAEPARGRYELQPELVLEDVLGLVRRREPLGALGRVRVEPALVELAAVRALGLTQRDGMRHAFASSAGDGLAGVRDHEVGESLRRVHWRTTARRGRLTVRELEDHPREELHVVLDAAAGEAGGARRSPVFERAVEVAGSLALHAARCGIAVSFESHGARELHVSVAASSTAALYDALCSVEADGSVPLASQLARPAAGRLCIVTSDLGPAALERLRGLRARRRTVAVVALDAGSWEGQSGSIDDGLESLRRSGVEVAVVRYGDDLAAQLSPLVERGVAGAA